MTSLAEKTRTGQIARRRLPPTTPAKRPQALRRALRTLLRAAEFIERHAPVLHALLDDLSAPKRAAHRDLLAEIARTTDALRELAASPETLGAARRSA